MRIDWISKLQHLLQIIAFCLAIATIQYAFLPERPYAPAVAYSLAIGLFTWVIIDFGRHLLPAAAETGWPHGPTGLALVVGAIVCGYFAGSALADLGCRTFGWYQGYPPVDPTTELRNSLLITVLAGVAGSYYFYSRGKGAYLERQMGEARRLAGEARLKLLETQLEPHMLFNTLANLRALIAVDPPRAQVMLDHMIAYLRATLGGSRVAWHPLADEFARLGDYLELMRVRMGPRLDYALLLPDDLRALPVPPLLLQPLVENAIRHGLEPQVRGGTVRVEARRERDAQGRAWLRLEVADTGRGLGEGDATGSGFGLAQVRERLQACYGTDATLEMRANNDQGTLGIARIPLKND